MQYNFPPKVRLAIYIVGGVGSLVVGYLFSEGTLGENEVALWGGLQVFINGLAAVNVSKGIK